MGPSRKSCNFAAFKATRKERQKVSLAIAALQVSSPIGAGASGLETLHGSPMHSWPPLLLRSDIVLAMPLQQAPWRDRPALPWLTGQILDHVVVALMHNELAKDAFGDSKVGGSDDIDALCGVYCYRLLLPQYHVHLQYTTRHEACKADLL